MYPFLRSIRKVILPVMLAGFSLRLSAQDEVSQEIARIVYLDSIVVRATQSDFSVSDFIDLVRKDESFYLAFRNLRAADYLFRTEMQFLDRKGGESGSYQALHHQVIDDRHCRYQQIMQESTRGKFFKKKKRESNFYTYQLFDRLFLLHDTTCHITVQPQKIDFEGEGMEGHVAELKKLIFSPGTPSDVPFIGNKSEVFSDRMRSRYNFFISSGFYGPDSIETYVFRVHIKPEFAAEKNNRTVIKELVTSFSKSDFQVLGRSYQLAHYRALYQFNVQMDIHLIRHQGIYFPSEILYQGFWNIPFKKKETGNFRITFKDFK